MIEGVTLFPDVEALVSFFAFRPGGVSHAPFDSLNLGVSCGDDPDAVEENRTRLAAFLGAPRERWVIPRQVHGRDVAVVGGEPPPQDDPITADAVILSSPGVFALTLSADCPLVAAVDPSSRLAGVAHAGWRGTAGGIVETLLARLTSLGSPPGSLRVAVSPGISGEHYEVGAEVLAALEHVPGFDDAVRKQGRHVDLRSLHSAILRAAGVPEDAISISTLCSFTSPHLFSHRRDDGRTGRSGLLLGWR